LRQDQIAAIEAKPDDGVELLYNPSESIFAAVAPAMVDLGWSVFPQETTGERRMPGKINGQAIRWAEDHDLKNKLPTPAALDLWCKHCATLNVACVFGPASGNSFAVDIDVTDEEMVAEIVALAEEILGPTRFRREGRAPKIALIYRHGPEEKDRVPSLSRMFAEVDPHGNASRSEHGIEILGEGKLITFHGRHHKTGQYFKWLDANPLMDGPGAAPLVTPDQVQTFLEAVDARWRFHRGASFAADGATWQWDETNSMRVPKLALAAGGSAWTEDSDGKVKDGREAYLSSLAYRTVTGNQQALFAAKEIGGDAVQKFKQNCAVAVVEQFQATAVMTGRWRLANLRHEAKDKVSRLVDKVLGGKMPTKRLGGGDPRPGEPQFAMPPKRPAKPGELVGDPEFSFLKQNKPGARKTIRGHVEPPDPAAPSLAIPDDRTPVMQEIQQKLHGSLVSFFKDVYGADTGHGDQRQNRVHILKAPTGAGKTSQAIKFIAADPRTYDDYEWVDEKGEKQTGRAPIVFLLPTYDNIEELRKRALVLGLDPNLSDADLRAAAEADGLIHADDLDGKLAELRRDAIKCGLKTMIYKGKIKAGCAMKDKVEMAMAAGISTSAFCKAVVPETPPGDEAKKPKKGGKKEKVKTREVLCEHYEGCAAIRQRQEISNVHVVFMPHAFLSLSIPEELGFVRAVVADERIHHLFLHTATFSESSLLLPRRPPRLTKREKERAKDERGRKETAETMLADRQLVAEIALEALRGMLGGQSKDCVVDPAEAILDHRNESAEDETDLYPGPNCVRSALRVCGNALQRDGTLSPEMSLDDVKALCAQPTGKDVREEWRFWKIIEERIANIQADRLHLIGLRKLELELSRCEDGERRAELERKIAAARAVPMKACGAADARIQLLSDYKANGGVNVVVRISWRSEPNWLGRPMLLLDASAAPPIVAKIWRLPEEKIVVHDIVADIGRALNVKTIAVANQTFSNASLIASPSASAYDRAMAARNLANVRQAIASTAALWGDGRVVAGTSIVLRQVINNGWACPDNVDWCHYGAMRGLDMFKFHSAAISIGRMEVPIRSIDGLVAALTYDDQDPEPPFDALGTGLTADGQALVLPAGEQRLRMRDGHVALIPAPMFPGKWGRLIQRQYREEETLQFVGRLRPVYRMGRTPVWVCLSSVIPEEIIVDEIIHIEDFNHGRVTLWEAARQVTGVTRDHARIQKRRWRRLEAMRAGAAGSAGGDDDTVLCQGVVDAEVIAAACPELFRSAALAEAAMAEMGLDPKTGAITARAGRGHAAFRWRPTSGGPARHAFVRGSAADAEKRLRRAIRVYLEIPSVEIECLSRPEATLARERPADKVDSNMPKLRERSRLEGDRWANYGRDSMDKKPVGGRGERAVAEDRFQAVSLRRFAVDGDSRGYSAEEVKALLSINEHWAAKGGVADDRIMPVLSDAPANVIEGVEYVDYEVMGACVNDEDPCL
jgi:hypothetical protein